MAGISGGRTSGEMAYSLPGSTVLTFQNTGREAAKTLDFIAELEQDLGRSIVRLEFRAPPRGDEPKYATFEVVQHQHLSRKGEPFRDMLECLRTYRKKHKGAGPVAPWARQRICTSHLKIKTQRRYCASLGWGGPKEYIEFIGLRADEPLRVAKMRERNDKLGTWEHAPLSDAGITKPDILRAWSQRTFDLGISEYLGNCDDCFLKDEADLATAMMDPDGGDPLWWIKIEEEFAPMRRGRPSYAQVYAEAPDRMKIRAALAAGVEVPSDLALPANRVRLIIRQEIERAANATPGFSCECDTAKAEDLDEYETA